MKQKPQKLILSKDSASDFILFTTDRGPKEDKTLPKPENISQSLKELFPNMLSGSNFIDYAISLLQNSEKFCALIIKIDEIEQKAKEISDSMSATIINIARIIDNHIKGQDKISLWGQIDYNMLGCFLDGIPCTNCLEIAKDFQQQLAKNRPETISIGIATYPFLNFKKEEIIENSYQSLDHAAFFGMGSIACFDSVTLNINGDKLYQVNDIEGAVKQYKRALMIDPENVNVHNSLGVCYGMIKDYDNALSEFEIARRLNPEEVMAIYNAGLVYTIMKEQDKGLEYFTEAFSKDENIFEVLLQIGKIYIDKKNYEKAKEFLEKAAILKPDSGLLHRLLGDCLFEKNMIREAISQYHKSVKSNPNDAASLSALGFLYDLKGENPEISTVFCKQSIIIEPENGLFKYRLGQIYFKQNLLEEALNEFKEAAKLGHDSTYYIEKIENMLMAQAS